jgi:hypothetical protein
MSNIRLTLRNLKYSNVKKYKFRPELDLKNINEILNKENKSNTESININLNDKLSPLNDINCCNSGCKNCPFYKSYPY